MFKNKNLIQGLLFLVLVLLLKPAWAIGENTCTTIPEERGKVAVKVDDASLVMDGEFDHATIHNTRPLKDPITCIHPNSDPIEFAFIARTTMTAFNAATGSGFVSNDAHALVSKCVGKGCEECDTGSYGLLGGEGFLFLPVALLDFADNVIEKGETYECDDDGDGLFGDNDPDGGNVPRVVLEDTPNLFPVSGPSGFDW